MNARTSLCLTSADFITGTNAASPDPTSPVYRLSMADHRRNKWVGHVRIGIGNPQSKPMTESSAKNINASTHLTQHDDKTARWLAPDGLSGTAPLYSRYTARSRFLAGTLNGFE